MSAEDNKAIYRRAVETLINQRNLDAMADFCTADYVWHGPGGKEAKGIHHLSL